MDKLEQIFRVPLTFSLDDGHFPDLMARRLLYREAARCGMQHLTLNNAMLRRLMEDISLLPKHRQAIADAGLDLVDAHAPYGPFWDLGCIDPEFQRVVAANLRLVLEICAMFGIKTVTAHILCANAGTFGHPVEEILENAVKTLREVLPLAEELGIIICIENIWFPSNSADRLLEIKRQLPTDALGFCYDAGHAHLAAAGAKDPENSCCKRDWTNAGYEVIWEPRTLEKMLPHIVNCHLHDNHGLKDEHLAPFDGEIDWGHVASLLKQAPRLAVVQSEVGPTAHNLAMADLVNAFRRLSTL